MDGVAADDAVAGTGSSTMMLLLSRGLVQVEGRGAKTVRKQQEEEEAKPQLEETASHGAA